MGLAYLQRTDEVLKICQETLVLPSLGAITKSNVSVTQSISESFNPQEGTVEPCSLGFSTVGRFFCYINCSECKGRPRKRDFYIFI